MYAEIHNTQGGECCIRLFREGTQVGTCSRPSVLSAYKFVSKLREKSSVDILCVYVGSVYSGPMREVELLHVLCEEDWEYILSKMFRGL